MTPKPQNSDTDNLGMQKGSLKVFPLSVVVKVFDLRKAKISYVEVAKIRGQNESSIHEIVKKEKRSSC